MQRFQLLKDWFRTRDFGYIAVALLLYCIINHLDVSYFTVIAGPMFYDWSFQTPYLNLWFWIAVLHLPLSLFLTDSLLSIWKNYVLISANAMLISCGYFGLALRTYLYSFPIDLNVISAIPIFGVAILMLLARFRLSEVIKINLLALCVVTPLALQYALIADHHN